MDAYLHVFPTNWGRTLQLVGLTVIGFILILILFRVTGKHIFTQTSPVTMIFLVSIGAIFAGSITQGKLTFVDGFIMLTTLILLISLTTYIVARYPQLRGYLNSKPTILYYNGHFLTENMNLENVSLQDMEAELRQAGQASFKNIQTIILESNGQYSIIPYNSADIRREATSLLPN
jgi:uncharacterized membrane protein YcaP (DUF421 family)